MRLVSNGIKLATVSGFLLLNSSFSYAQNSQRETGAEVRFLRNENLFSYSGSRYSSRYDQRLLSLPLEQKRAGPEFTMIGQLPIALNSNPLALKNGSSPSMHFDPSMQIAGSYQIPDTRLTINSLVFIEFSRYTRESANRNASGDALGGLLQLKYQISDSSPFSFFLNYRPISFFDPTFHKSQFSRHDISGGGMYVWKIGTDGLKIISSFDYGHRVGVFSPSSNFSRATLSVDQPLNAVFDITFQMIYTKRWIEGIARRQDDLYAPNVTISYRPSTVSFLGNTSLGIDFTIGYNNLDSSQASRSFKQWDIGPSVLLSWKF